MKNRLISYILVIFFIILCFYSILYNIYSLKIDNLEEKNLDYSNSNYYCYNLYQIGTSHEDFTLISIEESQIFENAIFFEEILNKYEEIYYVIGFTSVCSSFKFLVLFKHFSINKTPRENISLEIEGLKVTEEEMRVFELVQEYLNYNRVFNKEKVASIIKSRFIHGNGNLNYNGIKEVIDNLIKKHLILEGSKITRKTILINSNRRKVFDTIKQNPGIYMNELTKQLNLSTYTIKWHLSMLIKFNLIREKIIKGSNVYFDSFLNSENDILFHTISREKCKKIIIFLKMNNKGFTKYQIAKALHLHYNTITKYVNKLEKFNLLNRHRINNKEYLFLNNCNFQKFFSIF